jgi:hypothetical protein
VCACVSNFIPEFSGVFARRPGWDCHPGCTLHCPGQSIAWQQSEKFNTPLDVIPVRHSWKMTMSDDKSCAQRADAPG